MLKEEFITNSIETNLFFARIMREHTVFMSAALPQKNSGFLMQLERYRTQFDNLLSDAVTMSMGTVRKDVVESGQLVSPDTYECERTVMKLTGIYINTQLTERTQKMLSMTDAVVSPEAVNHYYDRCISINRRAEELTQGLKELKAVIYEQFTGGEIFMSMYPAVLRHVIAEADEYMRELDFIKKQETVSKEENTLFWARRSAEHAGTLEGMLDPSETAKKKKSTEYQTFFNAAVQDDAANTEAIAEGFNSFAAFNFELTDNILDNKLLSVILPLFTDHLYRETRRGQIT